MSQARPESTLSNAVTQPVSTAAELGAWWCPYTVSYTHLTLPTKA